MTTDIDRDELFTRMREVDTGNDRATVTITSDEALAFNAMAAAMWPFLDGPMHATITRFTYKTNVALIGREAADMLWEEVCPGEPTPDTWPDDPQEAYRLATEMEKLRKSKAS